MTDIYETEYAYENACRERGLEMHPRIRDVLNVDKDENLLDRKDLTSLYLAGNNQMIGEKRRLTDEDAEILAGCLKHNTYVVGLDLRYNELTDVGVGHIAQLLRDNNTLRSVNLMCNNFGPEGAKHLADVLQTNMSLTTLRLNGNKIGNTGGLYLAQTLQINTTLESLDLADTDQATESLIALATVLNYNRSLRQLNISRPIITAEQEETTTNHFARMLKVNKSLDELHMMKHGIRDFGVTRLAENLRLNFTLTYLNLNCNRITRDGAKQLAELLKCDTSLAVLDLGYNRIGDDGVSAIAAALAQQNKTLKALSVVSNEINGLGLCNLASCLRKTNTSLTEVYIWGNNLEESCCIAFKHLLDTGRLNADDVDVRPYVVDGRVSLAEVTAGLRSCYYWSPIYGDSADPDLARYAAVAADRERREAALNAPTYGQRSMLEI